MKWIYLAVGWVALSLGIAGIFLPLLPTTPFLLLAAFCFSKGSARAHAWLLSHRHFGPLIRDWQQHRAIPLKAKILATVLLLPTVILLFGKRPLFVKGILGTVVVSVLFFLWTRRTATKT